MQIGLGKTLLLLAVVAIAVGRVRSVAALKAVARQGREMGRSRSDVSRYEARDLILAVIITVLLVWAYVLGTIFAGRLE